MKKEYVKEGLRDQHNDRQRKTYTAARDKEKKIERTNKTG